MKKILIVDDDSDIRKVLKARLELSGFKCFTAKDGREAVKRAKYNSPSLIILDLVMPGMDGFETYKSLKADEHTKNIPIIAYTAQDADIVAEKGIAALDIVEFILKPFDTEVLMLAINKSLADKE